MAVVVLSLRSPQRPFVPAEDPPPMARSAGCRRWTHQNLVTAYSFDSDAVGNLCRVLGHGQSPRWRNGESWAVSAGQALT